MPTLRFVKYQGLQNDFIVVEAPERRVTAQAAARLCHRRRGVGADGILSLTPPKSAGSAFTMHVFNADGSEAEMCGNGLRCVVRHHLEQAGLDEVLVDTAAGLRRGWREGSDIGVTLGTATLIEDGVVVDGAASGTGISMGNPHLVLAPFPLGEDLRAKAEARGPGLERHARFPERVNVGFCAPVEDGVFNLVVFERGSGITDACGTGAGAAATALARRGLVGDQVTIRLPGGPLRVELEGEPQASLAPGEALAEVRIVGDAVRVFEGRLVLEDGELEPLPEALASS